MILQEDVFYEDEAGGSRSVIRKYFPELTVISDEDVMEGNVPRGYGGPFRGSLFLASRLGRKFGFCDALAWAPTFRESMVSKDFFFQDACHLVKSFDKLPPTVAQAFIRPTRGNKVFSGNVFNGQSFKNEFDFFTKSKNENPYTLCMVSSPKSIAREWRVLFAGGSYCGSSQYMVSGEREISPDVPSSVIDFAKVIASKDYFANIFDFVLDVGETSEGLGLVEINALETSSFYAADLNLVYSTWAQSLSL